MVEQETAEAAAEAAAEEDGGLLWKLLVTGAVLFLAPWGLIFEPGPISEITAIAVLAGVWGFSVPGISDDGDEDGGEDE